PCTPSLHDALPISRRQSGGPCGTGDEVQGTNRFHRPVKPAMAPCAGLLLVASALAGCATPRVALPDSHLEIPQQWQIAQASERSLDLASYWRLLDDPLLTEFVETAVANNLDLAQSAARLEQARAQLAGARAG